MTYYREKADRRTVNASDAMNEIKIAQEDLKLRKLEAEAAREEGNAHGTADVRRVWNDVIGSFRMRLWSLPQIASVKLVNIPEQSAAYEILRGEVRTLAELLRDYRAEDFYARNTDYGEADMSGEDEEEVAEADE
jgi:hypothetical protein